MKVEKMNRIEAEATAKAEREAAYAKIAQETSSVLAEKKVHEDQHSADLMLQLGKLIDPVIAHQDEISAFMSSRDFGKDAGKIRAATEGEEN